MVGPPGMRKRKLVEHVFGWMKTVGGLRKLRHRGIAPVERSWGVSPNQLANSRPRRNA